MISPFVPHVPDQPPGRSQIATGEPPSTDTRFSFPPAQKPIDFESGDQNTNSAFSVPAKRFLGEIAILEKQGV